MNNQALFKISYGLYVLSVKDGDKDNGCIINTAIQLTDTPLRISITVNKQNYTHTMLMKTKEFNLSMLDQSVPFEMFKNFGFQSGKDADKFKDIEYKRSENGIAYLGKYANAYISAKVRSVQDLDTHTMFIAEVTDAEVLSQEESVTYSYYQKNIKPAPKKDEGKKTGWRCEICGYVYEGDPLPEGYICPICKHGAIDFVKIEG